MIADVFGVVHRHAFSLSSGSELCPSENVVDNEHWKKTDDMSKARSFLHHLRPTSLSVGLLRACDIHIELVDLLLGTSKMVWGADDADTTRLFHFEFWLARGGFPFF
jgi:hypothetical protein